MISRVRYLVSQETAVLGNAEEELTCRKASWAIQSEVQDGLLGTGNRERACPDTTTC